jgi:competence protein ComEC
MGTRITISKVLTAVLVGILLFPCLACTDWFDRGSSEGTPSATVNLKVHFVDVGQGDAILIDYGTTEVLIDAGEKSPGVTDYLKKYVDGDLEAMVATHPHSDHIGGLTDVLDKYTVDAVWTNGDAATSKTYTDFINRSNAEGAKVSVARRGDTITAGALTFNVLNPPSSLFDDTNDNSIVLLLRYGAVDFLFTGDAEIDAENSMISAGVLSDIDILKVGHHGSRTASSPAFLAITRPEVAIYMAGVGNSYGHPHNESIMALTGIGAKIYGTDNYGTIVIDTNGATYSVQTEKRN